MNRLGMFVKEERLSEALTQKELAKKLHITNVTLSKIENGIAIGSSVIRKLAKYYKTDTRQIRQLMLEEVE